jgi:acetylornithine deacetylase
MLRVTFRGKAGWSFSPEKPIDPTSAIAHFIQLLSAWAAARNQQLTPPPLYRNNPALPVLINQLKAGDVMLPFFADRIPSHAWLCVWIGVYPGMTQEAVLQDLQAFYRQAQAADPLLEAFDPLWEPLRFLAGSQIPVDHPGVGVFVEATSAVRGEPAVIQGAPFACDGHMFNLYSPTPMLLLGPEGGNPHSPDEFVDIESYLKLIEIFIRGTLSWCGAAR